MKRLFSLLLSVMLIFSVSVSALAAEDELRDSLVLGEPNEWWGADVTQLDGTAFTQGLIGDPLCTLDGEGNLQPGIASDVVVSDDALTITMTFPEGMYFASGEQLEPEDVVASVERMQRVSPFSDQYETITGMDVDGRDVIFHLDHFSADLYAALSSGFITVMDKDVLDEKTDDELYWDCQPYGLYSMVEYVQGSHVVLERNPGYKTYNSYVENKGPAKVQEVTIRFITEEFTMAQEFNAGNIQYITSISGNGADQVTADNAVREQVIAIPNVNYLEMNLMDDVTGDPVIREAIGLAIDREQLCELCDNVIYPVYSYVSQHVRNHNADWAAYYKENYCNDVDRANELLDEAGYLDSDGDGVRERNGEPLILHYVLGEVLPDTTVAQGLQMQLSEIGIALDLDIQEDNYHYEVLVNGDFQVGMSRFGTADPILLLQWALNYFDSFEKVGGEDAFFAAVDEIAQEPDSAARTEMIYDLEELLGASGLIIPLYCPNQIIIHADDVSTAVYVGDSQVFFNDMA